MTCGLLVVESYDDSLDADFRREWGSADAGVIILSWDDVAEDVADWSDDSGRPRTPDEVVSLAEGVAAMEGYRAAISYSTFGELIPTNSDESWTKWPVADLSDSLWDGVYRVDGRVPQAANEIALSRSLMNDLNVSVGDRLEMERPAGVWAVVGELQPASSGPDLTERPCRQSVGDMPTQHPA